MTKTTFSVITVIIVAFVSMLLRSFSFFAFPKGAKIPKVITRLGDVLPYGIMGFLVIYCLKDTVFGQFRNISGLSLTYPYGIPEIISVLVCGGLQAWRHSSLLSVLAGTACYMFLIQVVFI